MPAEITALLTVLASVVFGWTGWRLGVRQTNAAARESALGQYRWAVEQISSGNPTAAAAGWVTMQTLTADPYLTDDDRRMLGAAILKLRAITGGTP